MAPPSEFHRRAAALFADALDHADPEAFLAEACDDDALRAEVHELLAAHDTAGDDALTPLRIAPPGPEALIGRTVGPWRLDGVLGTGGMGVVYEARRVAGGFEQRAALKRVRPGVGADFRARFLRERALLAGLDHAGVARLLDGGLDHDGAPYLAMELVEGEPITDYADRQRLGLRDRVGLFLQACEAVAHAHRHLVVHRDLKPAHVLVADDERGRPHVKLLDFGVAKLLEDDDDPGLTRTGTGPLTPAYAAPEQVLGQPITTATDVYALGVVLYELLTGRRPYDVSGLPISEAARVVATTLPARPSTQPGEAARTRRLRGDLDTVVMKALAKEPERRYASADTLADDLRRYLDGLPVEAQPDSVRYRVGKFVRRHRTAVASAALVVLALVGGLGAALWQARVASTERDRAQAEAAKATAINDFLTGMMAASAPGAEGRDVRVADLLDQTAAGLDSVLADQPDVEAAVRYSIGVTYQELGLYDEAETQYQRMLDLSGYAGGERDEPAVNALSHLGGLAIYTGDYARADSLLSLALDLDRALDRPPSNVSATLLSNLGYVRYVTGDLEGSAEMHQAAAGVYERMPDADPVEVAATLGNVAIVLADLQRLDEAIPVLERQVAVYREHLPPGNLRLARALGNLGSVYHDALRYEDADRVEREAVAIVRQVGAGDADHVELGLTLSNHGATLLELGRYDEADRSLAEALAIVERELGPDHPRHASVLLKRSRLRERQGRIGEAERDARQALAGYRAALGDAHPAAGRALSTIGGLLYDQSRFDEAAPMLREAHAILSDAVAPDHPDTAVAQSLLGGALVAAGRVEEGRRLLRDAHETLRAGLGPDDARTTAAADRLRQSGGATARRTSAGRAS